MSRLQRKCFAGSLFVHGAALAFLVFGTAFLSKKPLENVPPSFDVFRYKPTDDDVLTGGDPTVVDKPKPPAQAQAEPPAAEPPPIKPPAPKPAVEPLKPTVEPPSKPKQHTKPKPTLKELPPAELEPVEKPKVEDPDALKRSKKKSKESEDSSKTGPDTPKHAEKPKIKVNLDSAKRADAEAILAKRKAREEAEAREAAEAAEAAQAAADAAQKERARRLANVGNAIGRIQSGISSATAVEMPGPGGAAFANYGLIIRSFFNDLWRPPDTAADDSATVTAEIVLRRDGSVASAVIVKRSGSPALDRSVQTALDRSRTSRLPPFPDGAKEDQRTFRINFNLKAKQQSG